jgi:hypothetical protein
MKRRGGAEVGIFLAAALGGLSGACSPTVVASGMRPPTAEERLSHLEQRYADVRDLELEAEVARELGAAVSRRDVPITDLRRAAAVARAFLLDTLRAFDSAGLGRDSRRALRVMVAHLESGATAGDSGAPPARNCDPAAAPSAGAGWRSLSAWIHECHGAAAGRVVVDTDTLDHLTILARLATEADAAQRRRLFLSLEPLWRSVNLDNGVRSPYRRLVAASAGAWRDGGSPVAEAARRLGLEPGEVERSLERLLEAWRERTANAPVEPWDWFYTNGEASRRLSPRVPRDRLREINDRFFRDHGADVVALGVRYDLDPREGKTPVAFTQQGSVPRHRDRPGDTWVVATYRAGGLDNLVELLHETGHAVHLAAIDTRPAFADWPDADPFTEALGDVFALEAYEPRWQARYLGDSAGTPASLRAKYAGIMLDVAWALFELRLHADPGRDPNALWADLTSRYLGIVPHPELSWWAMRGPLVDAPGYMANYALGAIVAAEVRAGIARARGPLADPRQDTWRWLSDRLYRFGLERPVRDVLRAFLGGPPTPDALLADLARLTKP